MTRSESASPLPALCCAAALLLLWSAVHSAPAETAHARQRDPASTGNTGGPPGVQWGCVPHIAGIFGYASRQELREQRARLATIRRLVDCSRLGKSDPETGLTIRRLETVRQLTTQSKSAPPFYIARSIVPCWQTDEALRQICSPDLTATEAVVEIPSGLALSVEPGDKGTAVWEVQDGPRDLVIRCRTKGPVLLVLRKTSPYLPLCRIDGEYQPLYRVNYVSWGVVIPKGDHELSFTRRPETPWAAALIGLAALGLTMGLVCALRKRKAAAGPSPE